MRFNAIASDRSRRIGMEVTVGQVWLASSLWIGLALIASVLSVWVAVSVALIEIVVGAVAGNLVGLPLAPWVNFLAGFGAILLTFLAGAEIDPQVVRRNLWSSLGIGLIGFAAPYIGVLLFARFVVGWPWPQAQIAGISLSTTSVAVVYAVMIETGFNRTELGKIILAACFVNDLGTVLALGLVFADYDLRLAAFVGTTVLALWLLARYAPRLLGVLGDRMSEPQTKFVTLVLLFLGGLASIAGSEAVLPAYLVGMVLAPTFLRDRELPKRMRVVAFTLLTPFYFLRAGSLVDGRAVYAASGLIMAFLAIKMVTKFVGILPLTRAFSFVPREGMYTTLMMSTGLTFGTISALFGLTNHIIDARQYTVLVSAVIGSAVAPTLIAQRWFQPVLPDEEDAETERTVLETSPQPS
jgi:Kef-type K+ transport system membrane component KefB